MLAHPPLSQAFLTEDFLLHGPAARRLYHEYAAHLPIIDYHNHLSPEQLAADHRFENLTQIWLAGDHYKWRAMRWHGVPENGITGSASDREKFRHWAATVPFTVRNPLYHWTHLELQKPFGWMGSLDTVTADEVYDYCSDKLQHAPGFSVQGLMHQFRVEVLCTTDDPTDDLRHHQALQQAEGPLLVLPTFRPDRALVVADISAYNQWVDSLGRVAQVTITSHEELMQALFARVQFFHDKGCRLADHGLNRITWAPATQAEVEATFRRLRAGQPVSAHELEQYATGTLLGLCRRYAALGWTQQFHLGALRNNNRRLIRLLGADVGADSMGHWPQAEPLAGLLATLDAEGALAKTILYNLNPADNALFATMAGNFQDGITPGKVQYGASWWFLDQKQGIEDQLNALSNFGLLSHFVGMLTDSRSFLSFSRHEYFRRVLCNLIGTDIDRGELPTDYPWLGQLVQNVCYHNARRYFGFACYPSAAA